MKIRAFEGFETFTNSFKMVIKMHLMILLTIFVIQLFVVVSLIDLRSPAIRLVIGWNKAALLAAIPLNLRTELDIDGQIYAGYAKDLVRSNDLKAYVKKEQEQYFNLVVLSFGLYLLYPATLLYFRRRSKKQIGRQYIRGARLVSAKQITKRFRKDLNKTDLPLGSIKMPIKLENRQTMLIGKPGSGKTQAMRLVFRRLKQRGEQGIIYDNKGDYFSEFFDPETDLLFNPLDSRSLGWNLFNELVSYPDIDAVAASLVPPSKNVNSDPFFPDAARGVFSGILHHLYQTDKKDNAHLWELLSADALNISEKLKVTRGGEAGYRFITQNAKNSRQAESVLAVLMQYTKCFEYMAGTHGDFTINDWLESGRGFIFITNYDIIEDTLRPVLSLFIDLVCRKLLSLPDSNRRRIYLMLDEFGSLQRLPTLINLLTKGRSKGACSFLGIQDDGQIEKLYTAPLKKSADNACGNRCTFALSGQTAEIESRYNIGETEYFETNRSMSMGPHSMRDGLSLQKQRKREPLFLPSDIANFQDLNALVKLKGYDFVLSKWRYERPEQHHESFVLRKDLLLENIVRAAAQVKNKAKKAMGQNSNLNIPVMD